jgi:hypothetical protein
MLIIFFSFQVYQLDEYESGSDIDNTETLVIMEWQNGMVHYHS